MYGLEKKSKICISCIDLAIWKKKNCAKTDRFKMFAISFTETSLYSSEVVIAIKTEYSLGDIMLFWNFYT